MSGNIQNLNEENTGIDLKQAFFKYLYFWKWFLLCFIITTTSAYFYLRYSTPAYNIEATILIKDDKKGGLASELSSFADLGLGNVKSNVDNETEVLKARTLIKKAILELNLNVTYFYEGRLKVSQVYIDKPI